jgi:crotonobetainyl-CoA:carnitine CoA-transferase CaiB-like acyl-CoA transferase
MSAPTTLPLDGMRVVEFTHMVMGPTCGMILADLGAEVIKIEPPGGDKTRRLPGLGIGFFRSFNRNKKSVVLDITTPEGHAAAVELIGQCDVMLENFRPGLMSQLGLDYETLSKRYPRLIYVSHKGFLPGPYEKRLALDEVVQMMGGLAYMTGPAGRPLRAGTSVNDIMGGMFGAIGVLAALRERDTTGRGQEVQSALFENCVFLSAQHMQQFSMTHEAPPPMPSRVSAWSVYDVFTLADGEQLFIGAVSDKQFVTLCEVLQCPELAAEPQFATNALRVAARAVARAAWRDSRGPPRGRALAATRSCGNSLRADRAARPVARRSAPESKRRTGADGDRGRRHHRRRAAAAPDGRPPAGRAPGACEGGRAHAGNSCAAESTQTVTWRAESACSGAAHPRALHLYRGRPLTRPLRKIFLRPCRFPVYSLVMVMKPR